MTNISSEERLELALTVLTLEGAIDGLLKLRATDHDRALDDAAFNAYRDLVDAFCDLAAYIDSRPDLRLPPDTSPSPTETRKESQHA